MENIIMSLENKVKILIVLTTIILIINILFCTIKILHTNRFRNILMNALYKGSSIFKLCPKNKRKIVFINGHSNLFNGNIKSIYDEISNNHKEYKLIIYKKDDMNHQSNKSIKNINKNIAKMYNILTSEIIIVNDYISLFSKIKVRKSTQLVQVWHAGGAFKKFGADSLQNINNENNMKNCIACHGQYDKAIVSSEAVREIYAGAFGINKNKVLPLGLSRADKFYKKDLIEEIKNEFLNKYENIKQKKVILYAPTYRDGENKNFKLKLDLAYLYNNLSDEYVVIMKMHPFIKKGVDIPYEYLDKIIDLSYEDIDDLMIVSDILVTDYSSMIFEYAILEKPMIFFAYDLHLYDNKLRGFYYNYKEFVPGSIVQTTEQIVQMIEKNNYDFDKIFEFKKKFNGYDDGNATKRIVENLLN